MRPLDFLGRIKVKLGIVIVLAVATAFVVNEVGINSGLSREVRIGVAVVLALIMVQLLAMGMTRPLREMARAAQTIAKGRYALRVQATSRDEVGELARAFNAMAADLGEVDRQRRELIANVSHELRTPITGLRAVLENVVDGVSAPDPATMRTALAQTERLGRLVAQLLDLSRLDSGARLIEPEAVELRPLVEQAVAEAALAREDVRLASSAPAGLVVRADPDLLAQVLANLLDNAVRHSPPDGTVTVTASPAGPGVRLAVADRGPGIPASARGRVFERFSRLDAGRTADGGGAGLGLAIVKEIVELHGGSIRIDDCAGCRMIVDLPGRTAMGPEDDQPPNLDPQEPALALPRGLTGDPGPGGSRNPAGSIGSATPTGLTGGVVPAGTAAGEGALARPGAGASGDGGPAAGSGDAAPVPTGGAAMGGAGSAPTGPGQGDAARPAFAAPASASATSAAAASTPAGSVSAALAAPANSGVEGAEEAKPASAVHGPAGVVPAGPGEPELVVLGGDPPVKGLIRIATGGILGLAVGFVAGLLAAAVASVIFGDGAALVTLVCVTALFGAIGASLGANTARRAAEQAHLAAVYGPGYGPAHPGGWAGAPVRGATVARAYGTNGPGEPAYGPAGERPSTAQAPMRGQVPGGGAGPGYGQQGPPPVYTPPPLFPRPELPGTPRWLLPAAGGAGVFAAIALPEAQVGLGIVLVGVVLGAAALPAVARRMTPWTIAFGLTAYWLIAMAAVRDADWLVGILLLAGAGLVALAVSGAGLGWLGVIRGGASVLLALGPLPWFLAAPLKGLVARRRVLPMLAGIGITVVLLAVFGLLFASADPVFASYVRWLTSTPDWAESLPARIVLFGVFAALLAAMVLVALRPVADPVGPDVRIPVSRSIWLVPLTAVNLLFAAFVAVQITALFGGDAWVLKTAGLTYAEYARQGFFQLVVVSVVVLGIVAVAASVIRTERRERWLLAGQLGVLCALTMVVLFSALHRMGLYTDAYGLSRLRLSVEATVYWLGAMFALVLLAGAGRLAGRGSGWLPRTAVLVTGLALGAFAVVNPDLRVAESQVVVRGVQKLDSDYLGDLGAEAVPALDRLPEPLRSCVLADVVKANGLDRPDPWNGWNLARTEARALLAERPILTEYHSGPIVSRSDGSCYVETRGD
ncbi:DUF4153 domain-containing protein [Nonomuraea sp. NPDC048826]|uniref:DUF4153 domain-containing protein n=1 Tax=Nonomuraea sp. NPDC048826 TaxID=3364347 RepID=UPI00371BAA8D